MAESDTNQHSSAYNRLYIRPNPDGTFTRLPLRTVPPSSTTTSKDAPINHVTDTWARLFLPRDHLLSGSYPTTKLPIIVFVHGGGFIICSPAYTPFHDFCADVASRLGALVVSVSYRLAPEHRLPAAYDDVMAALTWVRDGTDEWVREYGDLSRCVMVGESAGGNVVYHTGLIAADGADDLQPLIIRGLVLIQPYFGGVDPTPSELRLADDPVLPRDVNELMWRLALPEGEGRGHEYCDPTRDGGSGLVDRIGELGWRVGLVASEGDPLYDRAVQLGKLMEVRKVRVERMATEGESHGAFVSGGVKRKELCDFLMGFLS